MPQAEPIRNMFNNIAGHYDLLNDVLSLGIHRIWKNKLIRELSQNNPKSMLDCATGTGDIAISFLNANPNAKVTGIDFSPNMLSFAKEKTQKIDWQVQDVTKLPFEDNQFDVCSISYGIRNVEDMEKGISEMSRVSSKKLCILEFGQPENKILRGIYFGIMKYFIPLVGKIFNKQEAYQYLIDSSIKFPSGKKMVEIIKKSSDFTEVTYKPVMGGITYLYTATKGEA